MAQIVPFKGILYSKKMINDISKVVSPPYDVISEEKRQVLYDRHEKNVVRLDFNRPEQGDSEMANSHTRAAEFFSSWQAEGVLLRDETPALYLTSVTFASEGGNVTRYGLICHVALEPFEKGIVLPHEQTFSKVKSERLGLLKACRANFSQIFSIYSDKSGILDTLKKAVEGKTPDIDIVDDVNERHILWKITDPGVIGFVTEMMKDKCLYIADGHHRYETALAYRKYLMETDSSFSPDHPANYIMMYLTSMEDPGLVILPTHRVLNRADQAALTVLLEKAAAFFNIETIHFNDDEKAAFEVFRKKLKMSTDGTAVGVVLKNSKAYHLFKLKPGVMDEKFGEIIPASLRSLDVSVLTHLIFIELLGFSADAMDQEKLITYSECDRHAAEAVMNGDSDAAFILNSTRIEQVREIAESGQTMPRKTTYFYPKALTGLVINALKS
jgi:uncharacterized protein (DUF1015 family)